MKNFWLMEDKLKVRQTNKEQFIEAKPVIRDSNTEVRFMQGLAGYSMDSTIRFQIWSSYIKEGLELKFKNNKK